MRSFLRIECLWAVGAFLVVTYPGFAAGLSDFPSGPGFEFDPSQTEQWKESEAQLPLYPKDTDLLTVPLPARDTIKIYIDRASLSRNIDRVIRFTFVIESSQGARSVFYEGVRCETQEYKTYAYGTSDRDFKKIDRPIWRKIPFYSINAFRHHLSKKYVCDNNGSAVNPEEVVRDLANASNN